MAVAHFTAPTPPMVDLSLPFAHPVFAKGQGFMTNPNLKNRQAKANKEICKLEEFD